MSDKSGAGAISLPKGGGAVTGMGEKFSPDLFTGTGNFSVPLALPAGRNGFQPELTLGYSTGGGNSAFGLGWNLGVPGVTRKTSKGIPRYDDERDVFILSGAEDLVSIVRTELVAADGTLGHKVQYRPRTEGLFARIEHYVYQDGRNYWQVRSKDGLISYYGSEQLPVTVSSPTPGAQFLANPANPAVLTDPLHPADVFAWHLTRTVDPFGNEIIYAYEREIDLTGPHQYCQTYLTGIRYGDYQGPAAAGQPGPTRYLLSVELDYSPTRPDPFSTYDAGFEQRTTRRCVAVRTYTHPETADLPFGHPAGTDPWAATDPARNGNRVAVKTYALSYADQFPAATQALSAASLLHRVQVMGHDGANVELMPPLEFGYSSFKPDLQRFFPVQGPLPATSLANGELELISIFGNGLPDLVQLGGGQPRYWRNLGRGRFAEPRPMREAPGGLDLADPDVQFIDANGDGKPDLLVNRDGLAGYFPLNHNGQWDRLAFRPYRQRPSFSLADPEVKLLDLDGDGITDVLRNGSRFEYFYNDPEQGFVATQQVNKSQLGSFPSVSFQDPRVRLAHLCSGLQGVAMVHNGRIEYWPNLGRGRWGQRLTMRNSPVFPRGYNPAHVLLGDVDGDGLDDCLYVQDNKLTLWLNQSGNGWSAPIEIAGTPGLTDASAVRVVDLLGTGVAGVLWTRDAAAVGRRQQYLFLDLTGHVKPYVLHQMDNHMGALTRVGYAPSTAYYLRDYKRPATRWQTPLPMPVQVVSHVEVIDRLSGGKMTTEYSYHHGYWDGGEREFRGFGRVDQRDTQTFERYNSDGLFAGDAEAPLVRVPGNFAGADFDGTDFLEATVVVPPRAAALGLASPGSTATTTPGDWRVGDWLPGDFAFASSGTGGQFTGDFTPDFQLDADNADRILGGLVLPVAAGYFAPPLETRTWFHLGPVGDGTGEWRELDLSAEYWVDDPALLTRPAGMRDLLRGLPRRQRRDAVRALRGTTLRTELYALDGSSRHDRPYTVTESLPGVAQVRGLAPLTPGGLVDSWLVFDDEPLLPQDRVEETFLGSKPIFFAHGLAQRTTQWERGTDPMTQLSFTADYDSYGQARAQLSAALPRGWDRATALAAGALVTYGVSQHAGYDEKSQRNLYDAAEQYLVDRVVSSTSWELVTDKAVLSVFDLLADAQKPSGTLLRKLLGHSVQYYDGQAFQGLEFGKLGRYGAPTRSEVLLLTPELIQAAYGAMPTLLLAGASSTWAGGWPAEYPAAFRQAYDEAYPHGAAGYHVGTPVEAELLPGGYYQVTERRQYDFQTGMTRPRGLVQAMLDPLGTIDKALSNGERVSRVQYDAYALLPVQTTDALGHQTTARYDYRLLQARLVTDPNLNRTAYGFSPLGLLCETALLGKEGKQEGDIKTEFQAATATTPPVPLSYEASTTLSYDFFAFAKLGQPCWVRTTQREQHYTVSAQSETLVKTEYSDGFGRLLQTRAQAEEVLFGDATFGDSGLPADPQTPNRPAVGVRNADAVKVNVVVSGWQVYDNKGRVVEKYEPFFSKGFAFVLDDAAAKGQCVRMLYDPRGQVIRTINPDGSEQRVVYGQPGPNGLSKLDEFVPTPWETYSYDANDLAPLTHPGQGRADTTHAFTPQSSEVDALGRVVRTCDRLGSTAPAGTASLVIMRYAYDIQGNRVRVTDALGRESFTHVYDLKPKAGEQDSGANVLFTQHLDGGTHLASFDGAGQPLRGTDAKGALTLHAYDPLGRPTQAWARDAAGETVRRRQYLVYGTDASQNNNGQLVAHYDEAGRLRLTAFDFKGNVVEKNWQVVADEVFTSQWAQAAAQNWAALPAGFNEHWDDLSPAAVTARLAPRQYVTSTGYDGLNRATQLTLPAEPGNGERRPVLLPTYNRAGALAQVRLDGEVLVRQLAYNARGQRLLLARGNGLVTRYTYDKVMFRLQRLRTEGYAAQGLSLTPQSGTTRQDTLYTYDLAGNITATRERAPQSGVAGTDELTRGFTYDALYRLLAATGRENQPTAARPWQESTRSDGVASTTAYTQNYQYDVLGNIQQLRHVASNSANSFTRTFDYGSGATNYLQTVQLGAATMACQYDAAGNVTQENGSRHYQWDAADQLRQFATWTGTNSAPTLLAYYLYAGGQRVKKLTQTSSDTWQVTVYADSGFEHRYEINNSVLNGEQTQVAAFDSQHRLYQRRIGDILGDQRPDKLYALDDHLGSTTAQTSNTGNLVSHEEYYPFGEISFGSTTKQRYRFCGKELDEESGLYYYGMRYYAAWLCRFVSVDPLAAKYAYYTSYQYAGNQPVNFIDLDGAEPAPPKANANSTSGATAQESALSKVGNYLYENSLSGLAEGASRTLENLKPSYTDKDRFGEPNLAGDGQPGEGKAMIRGLINAVQGTLDLIAHPVDAATSAAGGAKKVYSYVKNSTPAQVGNDALNVLKSTSRTNDGQHLEREEAALTAAFIASDIATGIKSFQPSSPVSYNVGTIRNVNPLNGRYNCLNCVIATEATLGGAPASALKPLKLDEATGVLAESKAGQSTKILEKEYGGKFVSYSLNQIKTLLKPGQRGIVWGWRANGEAGHVFNVVNQNGVIRFLDGQTGKAAKLQGQGYQGFFLLRTKR